MEWFQWILAIISGLVITIPLVIKLIEYVQKAVKERNWTVIVRLALEYMTKAEKMFTDGAEKKEWVMAMIKSTAQNITYNLDDDALQRVSAMIDSICEAAKTINTTAIVTVGDTRTAEIQADKIEIVTACTFDE